MSSSPRKTARRAPAAAAAPAQASHNCCDLDHDHDHDHHDHAHAQGADPAPGGYPPASAGNSKRGIYLISPSGALPEEETLERTRANLKTMGYASTLDRTALARHQRFAGTDAQRAAAFERAVKQKHDIVMATRGGYGLSRILDRIDWKKMADSGKCFVGHSDFTAFHLGLLAQTGAVSYAGPTAHYDFGGERVDDLTEALFGETMRGELEILSFETQDADPVDCRGTLWGGNLAMVTSLLGTPYFPQVKGGILFLEDVNEHPYRVERMLAQLLQAGVLGQQQAIVLGQFTAYRLAANDAGYDLPDTIAWLRRASGVPVITGLPFGHVRTKATLPVGARVGVATEKGMAHLVLQEHVH
jgi:muramoyltetrapeptide carboxypeptidase